MNGMRGDLSLQILNNKRTSFGIPGDYELFDVAINLQQAVYSISNRFR
jgi:hypothetical protein